ncbi:MAG: hypothetical protein WBO45_12955 [Planctomycetota bacterium]
MLSTAWSLPLFLTFLSTLAGCATGPTRVADRADDRKLLAAVQTRVAELGPGARAAVWLGRPGQPPALAWNVDVPMPAASAIKAAYLVELFAARADALDQPLPGADAVLADATHPAVAHFTAAQRATARQALGTASVRRIGEAMISSRGVDNATYNLAANLATAFLGGPAALDAKLHARSPEWHGLRVRRYMLANRTANGDNEATAHALADVHGLLATFAVPGLSRLTIEDCRATLVRPADSLGRARYSKSGALDSEPITRVEAGWCVGPGGPLVHVVMLAQDGVPAGDRAAAGQRLGATARAIQDLLLARP